MKRYIQTRSLPFGYHFKTKALNKCLAADSTAGCISNPLIAISHSFRQKSWWTLLCLTLLLSATGGSIYGQTYCASMPTSSEQLDIYNVTAGTLNNSSDYTQTGGTGSILSRYSDYTTVVAAPVFNQLATIPFSIQIQGGYYTQTAIWIDYNRNGTFEAPGERVFQTTGQNFGAYTQTGSFAIPTTSLTGNTRMRVITSYGSDPLETACGDYSYGETEDYLVNIAAAPACSGSPIQTNTIATQNAVCPNVSFTFSLSPSIITTGNTYQWYNNAGLIAGATSATYTATITKADNFHCKVTCPTGAKTTASTPVAIQDPYLYCSCTSASDAADGDKIFNVKIGTLDNSSTCDPTGGPGSIQNRYSNYTTIPAPNLTQLNPIPFSIEVGPCDSYSLTSTSIWIDYNHNGSFDAPGERVYNSGVNLHKPLTLTGAIIIPESALKGLTRMRIITAKGESIPQASACGSYDVGETEDYFVNIVGPVYCSGVPAPGNTIASQTTACLNTDIDLSFSASSSLNNDVAVGLTFQWFNNAGAIAGATNPTYTATITAADKFYCKVTCSQSGQTGQSTPVSISLKSFDKCYCTSMATSTNGLDIFNVTAGTLNNSTTIFQTGGPESILNRYSDFTTLVSAPVFNQLASIPFSVQIGASNYYSQTSIWIDYNHNGTFENPGERVFQSTGENSGNYIQTGSFTIPVTALTGITRMRVITNVNSTPVSSACVNYVEGETEDYLVNIAAPPACSGSPIPTKTIATQVCPESKYTFSLSPGIPTTGNTYQWYNSAGLIAGATGETYTTTITDPDDFYCKITCPNGNKTTTSTPITVLKCYCTSGATDSRSLEIYNVTAGTLNNSSDEFQTGGPGSILNRYSDYTTIVAAPVFNQLATIPFSVQNGASAFYSHTSIWIDYNRNGAFENPGELVYQTTALIWGNYTASGSFRIPITASTGITRMRIVTNYGTDPVSSPCENYIDGETEDYFVNIAVPPVCSGPPIQTNTIATQNQVCPTVSFTFSLSPLITTTGNTYQWYNDAGLIAGATNDTYTATITKADHFYCKVTCPNGNKTTTSTPVAVQGPYLYCSCVSTATISEWEEIHNVTVGGLNNSSTCEQTGGAGSVLNKYSDYTTLVAAPELPILGVIPYSIITDRCGVGNYFSTSIWIDFNHNGVFDAPDERVSNSPSYVLPENTPTLSGSFTVPAGALTGLTRMRVISAREGGLPMTSACGEYGAGETEDYFVNIVPPTACNGSPIQTNTIATQHPVCPESKYTFSLDPLIPTSGNTYQWYNDAGLIAGATNDTYTTTITSVDHFYCKITCPNGNKTTTSTPVAVIKCSCPSSATSAAGLDIFNVTAGTLNNSSTISQTGGPGSILNRYSNFTGSVAAPVFNHLATIPFSVQVGASNYYSHTSIWIDYNNNGTFESPGERVYHTVGYHIRDYTETGSFVIPTSSLTGITLMRVITRYGDDEINSACENYSEGETEDYLVNISATPACSGSPVASKTIATQNPVYTEVSFTFSLSPSIITTGNTFQWYNNAGLIAGATNETYTTTITKADDFYCKVTCPNGNLTTTSTPVAVLAPYLYSYCISTPILPSYENIYNVTVGTLNNSSSCTQTAGPGSVLNKYSDFTTLIAAPNLTTLSAIPFSVHTSPCGAYGPNISTSIWIDFNHNGVFDAPGERVFNSAKYYSYAAYTESGSFIVPADALPGLTRMRVISAGEVGLPMPSACGEYSRGETEDYFVNVVVPACSGAPTAGNTVVSQNNVCANTSITLSLSSPPTNTNGITYQWFNNGGAITGATDANYTATVTTTDHFYCEVTCTGSGLKASSSPVTVNVTPVSLPTAATTHTQNVATTPLVANDCQYIAKVVPTSGFTEATVKSWIETTPPFVYVPRHYEITPNTSPNTATGTVTLYFSQADFNAYNGTITSGLLPTGPTDAAKITNFQILKYAGTSPTGLGYAGSPTYIPGSGNSWNTGAYSFVWNATNSIWEVTFPVTGFSGFLAKSTAQPLPVTLISFTGKATEKANELNWKTSSEVNFSHFEIQRSVDAKLFEKIGNQAPNTSGNYTYLDSNAPAGKAYYRLKMIDRAAGGRDGTYSFSRIVAIENDAEKAIVGNFYPNPGTGKVYIEIKATEKGIWNITTYDLSGKVISFKSKLLQVGLNKISIEKLNVGLNLVKFENGTITEIRKVIKE